VAWEASALAQNRVTHYGEVTQQRAESGHAANYLKHQVTVTQCLARRSRYLSEIAKHWIDGERTASGTVSESVNPAPGLVVGQCADGGQAETARPSPAAAAPSMPPPSPGTAALHQRVMSEMADRYDAHAEELARWSRETGNTTAEGLFEGASHGHTLRHAAAQALTDTTISAEIPPGQPARRHHHPWKTATSAIGRTPTRNSPRTAANFCKDGSWTVHTEPGAEPFQV
jgi:hypothetical protein